MESEQSDEDAIRSDDDLSEACRFVQEHELSREEFVARWAALERGWRAHIERHEQFAQSSLLERSPQAVLRVRDRHLKIATRLRLCAIDLGLGISCSDVAAKMMLDKLIEHLAADTECRGVAPAESGVRAERGRR